MINNNKNKIEWMIHRRDVKGHNIWKKKRLLMWLVIGIYACMNDDWMVDLMYDVVAIQLGNSGGAMDAYLMYDCITDQWVWATKDVAQ